MDDWTRFQSRGFPRDPEVQENSYNRDDNLLGYVRHSNPNEVWINKRYEPSSDTAREFVRQHEFHHTQMLKDPDFRKSGYFPAGGSMMANWDSVVIPLLRKYGPADASHSYRGVSEGVADLAALLEVMPNEDRLKLMNSKIFNESKLGKAWLHAKLDPRLPVATPDSSPIDNSEKTNDDSLVRYIQRGIRNFTSPKY